MNRLLVVLVLAWLTALTGAAIKLWQRPLAQSVPAPVVGVTPDRCTPGDIYYSIQRDQWYSCTGRPGDIWKAHP